MFFVYAHEQETITYTYSTDPRPANSPAGSVVNATLPEMNLTARDHTTEDATHKKPAGQLEPA